MFKKRASAGAAALLLVASQLSAAELTRGPYLQLTTSQSTTLRWRTDVATDSVVRYGTVPGNLTGIVANPLITTEHEVLVDGLSPDTRYYYSVGSFTEIVGGDDANHSFRTYPTPGTDREGGVTIWVTGDQGAGCNEGPGPGCGTAATSCIAGRVRDRAMDVAGGPGNIDVWIALGDNAYGFPGHPDATDGAYQNGLFCPFSEILRQTAIWPCVGNHDLNGPGPANHDQQFTLPANGEAGGFPSGTERWYSFDVGVVHLVSLQWDNLDPGDAMALWLVADLVNNTQPWTIVYLHGPPHTFGSHNSDAENTLIAYRQVLTPILEVGGVDLVLAGHSHNYERSALIDSGFWGYSYEFQAAVHELDSGDGDPAGDGAYVKTSDNGVVHAVVGNSSKGGAPIASPHPVVRFTRSGNGSALVNVTCDELVFEYVDQYNFITDTFTIRKPGNCPPSSCAAGTAPGGFRSLRVNGSAGDASGLVQLPAGGPMVVSVEYDQPATLNALEVFGRAGLATPAEAVFIPGWGEFCFAPQMFDPDNPKLFSLDILKTPGPYVLPWSRTYSIPANWAGVRFELQGGGANGLDRRVTNCVTVEIVP